MNKLEEFINHLFTLKIFNPLLALHDSDYQTFFHNNWYKFLPSTIKLYLAFADKNNKIVINRYWIDKNYKYLDNLFEGLETYTQEKSIIYEKNNEIIFEIYDNSIFYLNDKYYHELQEEQNIKWWVIPIILRNFIEDKLNIKINNSEIVSDSRWHDMFN